MGRGFKLLFARCEMACQRDELIEKLEKIQLTGPPFIVRFRLDDAERVTHLLDELKTRLENITPSPGIIMVAGLENLVPRQAKVFASPLVTNLSASRNSFPSVISCPLVLWTPDYLLQDIAHGAPDFFSIRSGTYYFFSRREDVDRRAGELGSLGERELNSLKFDDRRERLKEIESVIEEDLRLAGEQPSIGQARLLGQKAELHLGLHQPRKASEALHAALEIARNANDRRMQGRIYFGLGSVAAENRVWDKAEELYCSTLKIEEEFNDRYSQASTLHQLGIIAQEQRQWDKAEEFYLRALKITEEFNDRYSQASTLHQLGTIAEEQRQWDKAEGFYLRALKITEEFNDRYSQARTLHQLGSIAEEQSQWDKANEFCLRALKITEEFNDRHSQAITLHELGIIAQKQRQWDKAEMFYLRALKIKEEFNDRYAQASTLFHLGRIAQEQRKWAEAEVLYRKCLEIEREFDDRYGQAGTRGQLGFLFLQLGQLEEASEEFLRSVDIFDSSGDPDGVRQALKGLAEVSKREVGTTITAKVIHFLSENAPELAEWFKDLQQTSDTEALPTEMLIQPERQDAGSAAPPGL
jgi:tetratricopeptide (TPR) repeat protein